MRRHFSYANVVATLALVFAMSGGALAANHYLINSPKQINPKVLKKLRGPKGKTGAAGPTGATGPAGPATGAAAGSATGPAGGDLTGSYPNPAVKSGAITPSKTASFPGARVEGPSTTTVKDGEYLSVAFTTAQFDVGGVFSAGSPTKLTASVTGVYVVSGHVEWTIGKPGYRQLEIDGPGGRLATSLIPVAVEQFVYSTVSTIVKLNAGDSVVLVANQASGSTLSFSGASFAMNWVASGA